MKRSSMTYVRIISLSALFGIFSWIAYSALVYVIFAGGSLKNLFIQQTSAQVLLTGFFFIAVCLLSGVFFAAILPSKRRVPKSVSKIQDTLKRIQFSVDRFVDAVFWVDSKASFIDVNRAACQALGYSREELLTMTVYDIDPNFTPDIWPSHWEDLKKRRAFIIESEHRTKDGRILPVEIAINYLEIDGMEYNCAIARNISNRKKSEEALRESEEKFRNLSEQSPNMIFINRGGRIVYVNHRSEEILGYSKEEFYSSDFNFFDMIAPEYIPLIRKKYEKHMKGEDLEPYEYALLTRDGRKIDVMINTKIIRYDGENSLLGIVTDITDRKRAEEAIKESEEKFRNVAEQSPSMIFINRGGRIVYVNDKCEEIMGYDRTEFYSSEFDFLKTIAPEYIDSIKEKFEKHMRGEEVEPYEYATLTKDGRKIDVINSTRLIKYEGEDSILGIITDITDRKKAEKAIQKNRRDLMKAQQMANIGSWEWDIENEKVYWSEEMYNIFGINNVAELTVERVREVIYPDDFKLFENAVKEVYKSVSPKSIEYRILRQNGDIAHVHSTSEIQFDELGKPVGIIGTVQDITDRKKAEELRERLISDLQKAAGEIKTLSGLIPICASCKKIRDDKGYWEQIETYIMERSDAEFSHGLCPECSKKLYPDF